MTRRSSTTEKFTSKGVCRHPEKFKVVVKVRCKTGMHRIGLTITAEISVILDCDFSKLLAGTEVRGK